MSFQSSRVGSLLTLSNTTVAAFPDGLQIGGGINAQSARAWLDAGASHVIATSWVFREGRVDEGRLGELVKAVGKSRLVLDLSCRRRGQEYDPACRCGIARPSVRHATWWASSRLATPT